jgi:hypothetical protein
MRGDKNGIPIYPFDHAAKNSMTVSTWKEQRFRPNYPGFDVDVLDGTGQTVAGNVLLSNIRDSYSDG